MHEFTVGSLFAGIGGFDLGLERAGMRTVWQVELDPFCRAVLEQHFPDAMRFEDVRTVGAHNLQRVDVICGGFPCQDLSYAGAGAGLAGARSGLWSEYARVVGELRPRYVLVENVSALLARGLGTVLGDLAALGYDAEWDCIPASAVGAPHRRDRIWLVAYAQRSRLEGLWTDAGQSEVAEPRDGRSLADAGCERVEPERAARDMGGQAAAGEGEGAERQRLRDAAGRGRQEVADADQERRGGRPGQLRPGGRGEPADGRVALPDADQWRRARWPEPAGGGAWWAAEPDVGRVAHGVPARVDRLRSLGNALVPQIAEWIGRRIVEHEGGLR